MSRHFAPNHYKGETNDLQIGAVPIPHITEQDFYKLLKGTLLGHGEHYGMVYHTGPVLF